MAKKASSKKTGKTKKELLDEAIAEAVGAGKELHLESVDFSDPNRPKTCLEVDFPIISVNATSSIEAASGASTKPIYRLSKWWARRQSSVFRSMLIAAATKAPDDPSTAAKLVWESYYGNHQKNEAFGKLKVADIFMGGGTTIVEGARLGMQMHGNDLNPVAWFVVRNELAQVDPAEVEQLLNHIEAVVKPQIMPFYACDCPRGHKAKWKHVSTGKVMGKSFDPLRLKPEERADYEYDGPEVLYTFWAKHGPCQATGCGHRTPIMSSPVVATKDLTVKAWLNHGCSKCGKAYDIEIGYARLAPSAQFVVSVDESPFAVIHEDGTVKCPHCDHSFQDQTAAETGTSSSLGKAKSKTIQLTLLVHPSWLKGEERLRNGQELGGSPDDSIESTTLWFKERASHTSLIEFRGALPDSFDASGTTIRTGSDGGTIPKLSNFECAACGKTQDILESMTAFGKAPIFGVYAQQGYCPECKSNGDPFDGRFFTVPDYLPTVAAFQEWDARSGSDLSSFWPKTLVPEGFKTSYQRIPEHGYRRFVDMHNPRQRLVHSLLLKALHSVGEETGDWNAVDVVLSGFQQYLRYNSGFSFWHTNNNQISAFLSNNNYPPKNTVVESAVFAPVGDGSWSSVRRAITEGLEWKANPWEIVSKEEVAKRDALLAEQVTGRSVKAYPQDLCGDNVVLTCESATSLQDCDDASYDLVITDPPFGNNIQYSELADFFYVWLRLSLKNRFTCFDGELTPKSVEAVVNPVRNPDQPDAFYQRVLSQCWSECARLLKTGGILAFTFHHSEDEPWIAVLESLFEAGFYLEATYPIRSDGTRGEGAKPGTFGSQLIEYDIVHVCRKRVDESQEISWARLRRQILSDVRQLQDILEHHQQEGLQEADLQVIRRGKALEYYSKHYGKVYVEKGRSFPVREALAGINQLLDDQRDSTAEVPPVDAEPYTRQFLRLFADSTSLPRDQIQKYLRGTGVSPNEFQERGWCSEEKKVFHFTSPLALAQKWKGVSRQGMGRDFDQAMFLIGACYENSGIRVQDTLNNDKFIPHPATGDIIDWFTRHGGDSQMKSAARLAKQLYTKWVAANEPKVKAAQRTFDFAEEA